MHDKSFHPCNTFKTTFINNNMSISIQYNEAIIHKLNEIKSTSINEHNCIPNTYHGNRFGNT